MPAALTYDVLGVKVSAINPALAASVISQMIKDRHKGYVCVAPVSMIMDCQNDPTYLDLVNKASLVTPDGMPVAWLGRLSGHACVARTYGPDLMELVCDLGRAHGWKHFFYGATAEVCDRLERSLKQKYPGLMVVGKIAPPFMPSASRLNDETAALINAARPDIVWVGLGAPKQDFWNALNRPVLDAPVLIGIGAAFDFISGVKPQAPRFMQRLGLEWFFRLCCEPGRLWRRYLIGNTLFCWLLLKRILRGK